MTAAGSHQLSGLPGYRQRTLHLQSTSTFCVEAENEPAGPSDDWMRISELQARNKACLPHLKSSYPVEFENGSKSTFLLTDEDIRSGDPNETIRRASFMPSQLQGSVGARRHSLVAPQSTVSARSHRSSLMAGYRPSKLVSSSQLRSPRCQKRSAFTLSVPLTPPEKKMKASCFPRPLTPKNKNSNTGSSSSHLHATHSPADRRQSMMFTINNTPKSNRSNYLKRGLNKLRSASQKSPGKTPKRPPVNSAHKDKMTSATSIVALGRGVQSKSFKSSLVKDNRKEGSPSPSR
ncbi:nuclear mitotic apparatus protein 1-like [Stigmatopora nigra]